MATTTVRATRSAESVSSFDQLRTRLENLLSRIPDAAIGLHGTGLTWFDLRLLERNYTLAYPERSITARVHLAEYAKFLALKAGVHDYDGRIYSPSPLIDDVWHTHILDTVDYAFVCAVILGEARLLEHNPFFAQETRERDMRYQRTYDRLTEHSRSFTQIWPVPPQLNAWKAQQKAEEEKKKKKDEEEEEANKKEAPAIRPKRKHQPYRSVKRKAVDAIHRQSAKRPRKGVMTLHILTLTDVNVELHVDQDATTKDVKAALEAKRGIPVDQQRLLYKGHYMEPEETLKGLHVENGATLHLVLNMRGC